MKDGSIVYFEENNEEYRNWLKTPESDNGVAFCAGKDVVADMVFKGSGAEFIFREAEMHAEEHLEDLIDALDEHFGGLKHSDRDRDKHLGELWSEIKKRFFDDVG